MCALPVGEQANIYALREQGDARLRYVGRTKQDLEDRRWRHLKAPAGTVKTWLRHVRSLEIVALGTGTALDEARLIRKLWDEGHPLVNKQHLGHVSVRERIQRAAVVKSEKVQHPA